MNRRPETIAMAEQQVAEARTAVVAEYRSLRANLDRRARSPVFIGGVLLGAIALGYCAVRRDKAERPVRARGRQWPRALKAAQLLLPLFMALGAATRPARKPGAEAGVSKR